MEQPDNLTSASILDEAVEEARHIASLFTGPLPTKESVFDVIDQHVMTMRLAAKKAKHPAAEEAISELWGEAMMQRQLIRFCYLLAEHRIDAGKITDLPEDHFTSFGKPVRAAVAAFTFKSLIDAVERHLKGR